MPHLHLAVPTDGLRASYRSLVIWERRLKGSTRVEAAAAPRPHDCGGAAALRDLREGRG
jgi:hypothetical protein